MRCGRDMVASVGNGIRAIFSSRNGVVHGNNGSIITTPLALRIRFGLDLHDFVPIEKLCIVYV